MTNLLNLTHTTRNRLVRVYSARIGRCPGSAGLQYALQSLEVGIEVNALVFAPRTHLGSHTHLFPPPKREISILTILSRSPPTKRSDIISAKIDDRPLRSGGGHRSASQGGCHETSHLRFGNNVTAEHRRCFRSLYSRRLFQQCGLC